MAQKRTVTNFSCQLGRSPFLISICRCGCRVSLSLSFLLFRKTAATLFHFFSASFFFLVHHWRPTQMTPNVHWHRCVASRVANIKINYHKWTSLITRFELLSSSCRSTTIRCIYIFTCYICIPAVGIVVVWLLDDWLYVRLGCNCDSELEYLPATVTDTRARSTTRIMCKTC